MRPPWRPAAAATDRMCPTDLAGGRKGSAMTSHLLTATSSWLWSRDSAPDQPSVAYRAHWRVIGWLGIGLPFLVWLLGALVESQGWLPLPSISDYYALARPRDFFVGILWTMAWFFLAYKGYCRDDDQLTDLACVLALAVSLVPNTDTAFGWFHLVSAAALFVVLALISFFFFTKTQATERDSLWFRIRTFGHWYEKGDDRTDAKKRKDRLYMVSGVLVVAFLILALVFKLSDRTGRFPGVFLCETGALLSFGAAWLAKGRVFWFLEDGEWDGGAGLESQEG